MLLTGELACAARGRFALVESLEAVTDAVNGAQLPTALFMLSDFLADALDLRIHGAQFAGVAIIIVAPNEGEYLLPRKDLPGVGSEELKDLEQQESELMEKLLH